MPVGPVRRCLHGGLDLLQRHRLAPVVHAGDIVISDPIDKVLRNARRNTYWKVRLLDNRKNDIQIKKGVFGMRERMSRMMCKI